MRSLFWKFFVVIWLTLAASIVSIMMIASLFQTPPFSQEIAESQQALMLDTAEQLLQREGKAAVERLAGASRLVADAGKLKISEIDPPGECVPYRNGQWRRIVIGSTCYLLGIDAPDPGRFVANWPKLIPWLAALCASAAAAFWLTRYLIGPVAQLRRGLSALAQGRFDIRIADETAKREDEITALAHDFDASASRLQELQESQQRLFHDVSHELRSPLSRLQAALGVLRQNPAKLGPMMERMGREIERLDNLIGEIFTLARLTARARSPLDFQSLDVMDLLNGLLPV